MTLKVLPPPPDLGGASLAVDVVRRDASVRRDFSLSLPAALILDGLPAIVCLATLNRFGRAVSRSASVSEKGGREEADHWPPRSASTAAQAEHRTHGTTLFVPTDASDQQQFGGPVWKL